MGDRIGVCAVQTGPCSEDTEQNLDRALRLLKEAHSKYVPQIVCFNELFHTPFFAVDWNADSAKFFETIPGKTTDALGKAAREYQVAIIAGIAEKTVSGERFNSAVLIDAHGAVRGVYRKAHVPLQVAPTPQKTYEKYYFRNGNLGFPVFATEFGRVGILICYDRHFPEAFRTLAVNGAEIICIPTGARTWDTSWRAGMWEALLRTRAYENCVFVVACNRAGREGDTTYLGRSMIVSPLGGSILAVSDKDGDDLVYAEINPEDVGRAREKLPVYRDMRTEFYSLTGNKRTTDG